MSDELARLARRLEEDAARIAEDGVDDAEAARLAAEIARTAAEAAAIVERTLREPVPAPRVPGQGSLPVED